MNRSRVCIRLTAVAVLILATAAAFGVDPYAGTPADRESLRKTGDAIRAAFARGDLDAIAAYHHPDVIKALAPGRYLVGRDAVMADLAPTLQSFHLEFIENRVENTFFQGDTAVEESVFALKGTPKNDGIPFLFKGRSMVVYVRDKRSPSGWASIREIIQPAP